MAMTREKFLQLCASTKNAGGFRAYQKTEAQVNNPSKPVYRVYLDPGMNYPGGYKLLFSSRNNYTAYEAMNRFNMWLVQEGKHRDQLQKVGGEQ